MNDEHLTWNARKLRLMEVLCIICGEVIDPPPAQTRWPKTRMLANSCNETIYTTRLMLLQLEEEGKVLCSHRRIQNSLRWYPAHTK